MKTFVEIIADKLKEAEEKDRAEVAKNPRRFSTPWSRNERAVVKVPKVTKVTPHFSFVTLRGWKGRDVLAAEIRRLKGVNADWKGSLDHLAGGFFCAILYRDNLLIGSGNRVACERSKENAEYQCKQFESQGMTPERYVAQTAQWDQESKDYRVKRDREERMRAYASVVALKWLLTDGAPVVTPDGVLTPKLIEEALKGAKDKMRSALNSTDWRLKNPDPDGIRYLRYDSPLPEEWGGDPAPAPTTPESEPGDEITEEPVTFPPTPDRE